MEVVVDGCAVAVVSAAAAAAAAADAAAFCYSKCIFGGSLFLLPCVRVHMLVGCHCIHHGNYCVV